MEPHHLDHDGRSFTIDFERTPEGWVCRISREDDGAVQVIAFPDGPGFDPDDVRGSLIAGCEAAISRMPIAPPTWH